MDPVDWAAWGYGKLGHYGFAVAAFAAVAVLALVWARGVERYQSNEGKKDLSAVRPPPPPVEALPVPVEPVKPPIPKPPPAKVDPPKDKACRGVSTNGTSTAARSVASLQCREGNTTNTGIVDTNTGIVDNERMDFTSTVASFVKSFSNSPIRMAIVWAVLSCGHTHSVVLKPHRGRCCKCGHEGELNHAGGGTTCACGSQMWTITWSPHRFEHEDSSYITQIGDAVPCETCRRESEQIIWLRQLDKATVLLSRFRHGSYYFYRQDSSSPSGKMLIGGVMASPKIEAVLRELRYSPLSPTEMLGA